MSGALNQIIGQHLIVGVSGFVLTADEKDFLIQNNIGGVILFQRNFQNPKQIYDLCAEIQGLSLKTKDKIPFFIGIDMEGGRVQRLKAPFTQWPAVQNLGKLDNPMLSFSFAHRMGLELHSVGINLNFAPCADVLTNPKNQVIGDRALSDKVEVVDKHISALVRGYIKAGVLPCVKHFPGHGNTLLDSHEQLPVEDFDLSRLESLELIPFKKAFRSRVDMVMTAHIQFPKIDPEWPVTLSQVFLQDILRKNLRYRGLIFSDDLDMKALRNHYGVEEIPVRALQAGVDLLLYCNEPQSPLVALDAITNAVAQSKLSRTELEASYKRIVDYKKEKLKPSEALSFQEASKFVGHPEHLKIAEAIKEGRIPEGLSPE
ncbi:MAG TPA: beta-N-acetylhexosaminidase [Pseudobdellovibrionaceae bacterium]|nr:beta-N-acetylhexosaminidase [Pseudobdellovibrionaceae bacterium]